MEKKEKNIIDNFLDNYGTEDRKIKYKKIFVKPSKFKCVVGFIFSFIFLILLLTLISFTFMYFLLLFGDLLIFLYYSLNLFTKKGIGLPKYISYYEDEEFEDKTSRYKVQ